MAQLALFLPGILLAYSVFLIGMASPGPNILAIIGTSMGAGRRSGIALALGVALGSLTWGILTASGLSALLSTYAFALLVIKVAGGLYLLRLAFKSFRSAASRYDLQAREVGRAETSFARYVVSGYTVQMTNPKAALAWIATTSLGLQPGAPIWVVFVIVGGIFVLSITLHTLYAVAFSAPVMVTAYGRARRYIQASLGAFFTFAGLKLLTNRA